MLRDMLGSVARPAATLTRRFLAASDGATAIEYAFIASGVALVIVLAVQAVGVSVNQVFVDIAALF